MATGTIDQWLRDAAMKRVSDFANQLRQVDDGATPVPNLDWTVSDLAQHVACLPQFWNQQHDEADQFVRPEDFGAFVEQGRSQITETDPALLADLIEKSYEAFIAQLQQGDPKRWLVGLEVSATNICGLIVNEFVLHGRDLAGVTGVTPPMYDRLEANAAVDAMMATTPGFIDAAKAKAQPDGVYHVRFKGGNDYTWTKQGSELSITQGRPKRSDAKLIAEPATFLLASLNRISQLKAGLSGGMISYGLRPWRFIGLGKIAIDGI